MNSGYGGRGRREMLSSRQYRISHVEWSTPACAWKHRRSDRRSLRASGMHVAIDVAAAAEEQDPVPGRIRFVPFELVVRNLDFRSDVDMRPTARLVRPIVRDGRVGLSVPDVNLVGPIGIGFAAARNRGIIRLHQGLIPFADRRISRLPLSEIARLLNAKHA